MKMSFVFAALFCVSVSSSYAQIQILGQTVGTSQLASDSSPISLYAEPDIASDSYESSSPTAEITGSPDSLNSVGFPNGNEHAERSSTSSQPVHSELGETNESVSDASGLPVGRRHSRTIVDTILDQSVVNSAPMAAFAPQQWCQETCRNNAIGDILTRPSCVQGLWSGYEAERAAECARKQNRLNGHHHCHACTHAAPACRSCPPIHNRYQSQRPTYFASGPTQCDSVAGSCAVQNVSDENNGLNEVEDFHPTPAPALNTGYQPGLQPFTPPTPSPDHGDGSIAYLPLPYLTR